MESSATRTKVPPPHAIDPSGVEIVGDDARTAHQVPLDSRSAPRAPWLLYSPQRRWAMLAVLFAVTASSYVDSMIIAVLLEPIKKEFRVSDTMLGFLSGVGFAVCYALAAVPIARWADRGNRRNVVSVTLAVWSTMTALCGAARSYWQLAAARFALGAAEAGALAPTQSLAADYFPAEQRATAIGILNAAMNVGYLLGIGLGGYIAASYGWRAAFVLVGLPGLALAAVAHYALREPREVLGRERAGAGEERLSQTIAILVRKPSFVCAVLGISLASIFAYGASTFVPSFMIRTLHATLREVSVIWATTITLADTFGAVIGGWLADRLGRRDIRWHGWLAAITFGTGACLYWVAFAATTASHFIGLQCAAEFVLAMGFPAPFAAVHAVCGDRRRAMAVGIIFLLMMLCGNGLGPLTVGVLSDAFHAADGLASLRHALDAIVIVLLPAVIAFFAMARMTPRDLEV